MGSEPPEGQGLEPVAALEVHAALTPSGEVLQVGEFEGEEPMLAVTQQRDVGLDFGGIDGGREIPGLGRRIGLSHRRW